MHNALVLRFGQVDWDKYKDMYPQLREPPTSIDQIPNEFIRQMKTNWTFHMFVGPCPYQVVRLEEDKRWDPRGPVRPTRQKNPVEIEVAQAVVRGSGSTVRAPSGPCTVCAPSGPSVVGSPCVFGISVLASLLLTGDPVGVNLLATRAT